MDGRVGLPKDTILDGSYRIERMIGAGGFGVTYEAEDVHLKTTVALKEYYPADFGERDRTMSVRPKSERHKKTFEWGRSSFLQEAQMLARFRHPSIVQVTRVFQAHATAYMVMTFEQGKHFENWLNGLGRSPTQEELDRITGPLLDALEMMHAENFLHRDIAPDNIIVRPDGTPVLLDFGAARRAVAEMSRTLTGVVKAGYSPHEQYSSDSRLQGPWSDIYALGGTLYRAIAGRAPDEATLRIDSDRVPPAAHVGHGRYRPSFLAAIDACLKLKAAERPQSMAKLRPMLFDPAHATPSGETRRIERVTPAPARAGRGMKLWWAAAAVIALAGGSYGGLHYARWDAQELGRMEAAVAGKSDHDARRRADATAAMAKSEEGVRARAQAEAEAARREEERKAETRARREAEAKRLAEAIALAKADADQEAEAKRTADKAAQQREAAQKKALEEGKARAEAVAKREEELRIAAIEETRRNEEEAGRKAEAAAEATRLASIPDGDRRATFVRSIQQVLKRSRCYDGALTGRSEDAQEGLHAFVANAKQRGVSKPQRIDLAKASVGDFESWLRDADALKGALCVPKPEKAAPATTASSRPSGADRPRRADSSEASPKPGGDGERKVRCWNGRTSSSAIGCRNGTQ